MYNIYDNNKNKVHFQILITQAITRLNGFQVFLVPTQLLKSGGFFFLCRVKF